MSRTFSSLRLKNYRLYVGGNAVSQVGTWMQSVALVWLVFQLSGSSTTVGVVLSLQVLPVLLFVPYAGLIVDRFDRRVLLVCTNSFMGVLSLALSILVVTGVVRTWHVMAIAALTGFGKCLDGPARHAFIREVVGRAQLRNAVSLNSVTFNAARVVGPAVAGGVIAVGGTWVCFLVNALSFPAVIVSVLAMDADLLIPARRLPPARAQIRQAVRYAARTADVAVPLTVVLVTGALAFELPVVLPVLATETLDGDSRAFGYMTGAVGVGAIVGGLVVAGRGRTGLAPLSVALLGLGTTLGIVAFAPGVLAAVALLLAVGSSNIAVMATANTTVQLAVLSEMQGRVMSLWSWCAMGSGGFGAPIIGWVCEHYGARAGLGVGSATAFAAAGYCAAMGARRDNVERRRTWPTRPSCTG